uniref:RAN binding protein 3b n=1 Tax=Cyprinus carpio TaxID=7962 RepID=A0A8C1U3Q4_CYPCA
MADGKPAIAPPVFVFQKDKAQKRSADGSSAEDGDDSDRDDGEYCPPVKRERTSSLTQFPPSHSGDLDWKIYFYSRFRVIDCSDKNYKFIIL